MRNVAHFSGCYHGCVKAFQCGLHSCRQIDGHLFCSCTLWRPELRQLQLSCVRLSFLPRMNPDNPIQNPSNIHKHFHPFPLRDLRTLFQNHLQKTFQNPPKPFQPPAKTVQNPSTPPNPLYKPDNLVQPLSKPFSESPIIHFPSEPFQTHPQTLSRFKDPFKTPLKTVFFKNNFQHPFKSQNNPCTKPVPKFI